jgi:hypothetical protein
MRDEESETCDQAALNEVGVMIIHTRMWRPSCGRYLQAVRDPVNHEPHLWMCFFTCGLWAFVWLLVSAFHFGGWECPRCGSSLPLAAHGVPDDGLVTMGKTEQWWVQKWRAAGLSR